MRGYSDRVHEIVFFQFEWFSVCQNIEKYLLVFSTCYEKKKKRNVINELSKPKKKRFDRQFQSARKSQIFPLFKVPPWKSQFCHYLVL